MTVMIAMRSKCSIWLKLMSPAWKQDLDVHFQMAIGSRTQLFLQYSRMLGLLLSHISHHAKNLLGPLMHFISFRLGETKQTPFAIALSKFRYQS